jgi:hypothetical protein
MTVLGDEYQVVLQNHRGDPDVVGRNRCPLPSPLSEARRHVKSGQTPASRLATAAPAEEVTACGARPSTAIEPAATIPIGGAASMASRAICSERDSPRAGAAPDRFPRRGPSARGEASPDLAHLRLSLARLCARPRATASAPDSSCTGMAAIPGGLGTGSLRQEGRCRLGVRLLEDVGAGRRPGDAVEIVIPNEGDGVPWNEKLARHHELEALLASQAPRTK